MEIKFIRQELENLPASLSREWIDSNQLGSYASGTVIGMNTRRKHGLFVYQKEIGAQPLLILSHLQEELYLGQNQFPLYNVEYKNHLSIDGLNFLERFELDPFPSFYYKFGTVSLQKSLFFCENSHHLIISYQLRHSENITGVRLMIRPLLAYRPVNGIVDPEIFENTEAFLDNGLLRFLPEHDSPELFMQYPSGDFSNSPTWYHNFKYRFEKTKFQEGEDLFSPGFLEIPLKNGVTEFLSFAVGPLKRQNLEQIFIKEKEKRQQPQVDRQKRSDKIALLQDRIDNFIRIDNKNRQFFVTDLLENKFYLSLHCLMLLRLLQSGIPRGEAQRHYKELVSILSDSSPLKLFMGLNSEIQVEASTLFFVIFFLYQYHIQYDRKDKIDDTLDIILEIITLIRKNQLPFYRLKRHKLLERQYRKSELKHRADYEIFFPVWQNFLLNVFWYNILKMAIHLAELRGVRLRKYERWTKKIKHYFHSQYMRSFLASPTKANTHYNFVFHPAMIFTITLPFPIIEDREAQLFYRVLIKQFLVKEGIKYPTRNQHRLSHIISPILIAEYFEGWRKLMRDKKFLGDFFQRISQYLDDQLMEGVLGYIPNLLKAENSNLSLPNNASGVASCEVMYFFYRQITL